jgi:NTE family protein
VVIGEHLHVDGALLDNLPVEAMRAAGVGHVIAVDLAVSNEVSMTRGELPSALEFLKARLLPGRSRAASPGLGAILVKSLMMSSMQRAREVSAAADLVLKPEPAGIGLVEWTALDRGIALGYRCAKEELERRRVTQWVDRDEGVEVQ